MPSELLEIFNDGKIYSVQELSGKLKMDIPVIQAELEFLQRHGYIRKIMDNNCGKKCRNCCNGCGQRIPLPVAWELIKQPN
jgi:hypothetical protein